MTLKSEASQNNMVLSDRFGVDLFSQKEIHIAAGKNVKVQTGGTVTMNTPIGYHFENTKSGDCIDMSGNEMLMTTERAVISGLPHKLGHKPLQSGQDIGIGNPYQYASSIIGGIPQGRLIPLLLLQY
uniref:hypothetical protein n=1 Tax=Clostridium sp. NkU-1 TaxID=1095009 RepID=UPI0006D1D498